MKTLNKLLYNLKIDAILGDQSIQVSAIFFDSKKVIDASLFVAIKGSKIDGHDYIANAISNGARAIVCEFLPVELNSKVTYIQVPNSSYSLGVLASNFYNNPSAQIKLIGVTGTNGKTSIATYLYELFQKLNFKSGLLVILCLAQRAGAINLKNGGKKGLVAFKKNKLKFTIALLIFVSLIP